MKLYHACIICNICHCCFSVVVVVVVVQVVVLGGVNLVLSCHECVTNWHAMRDIYVTCLSHIVRNWYELFGV